MARMHRQVVAFADDVDDVVHAREVQTGVDALAVEIHRHNHDVHVAGAFAVAEQRAFNAVSARHHRQLRGGDGAAAVVVGVDADHDVFAAGEFAAEVFDLVGVEVRRAGLHRVRQVENHLLLRPRLPDGRHRLADLDGKIRLRLGEALRRILENPAAAGVLGGALLQQFGAEAGDGDDFGPGFLVDLLALDPGGGVVEMDHGLFHALKRFEGAVDEMLARLHQHLHGYIVGNQVLLDEPAGEVKFNLRGAGEANFDFLEAAGYQQFEKAQLLLDGHRVNQRLVAVAQIDADPDRRFVYDLVRPGAVGQLRGEGEGTVFVVVEAAHAVS